MKRNNRFLALLLVLCVLTTLTPAALAVKYPVLQNDSGSLKNEATGGEVLFSSDIHENHTYFETILKYLLSKDEYKGLGLIAIGGDYENGHDSLLKTGVTNALLNYANEANIPIVMTKGNHELKTFDDEFLEATGSIRAGYTATGYDSDHNALYHLYSFGAFNEGADTDTSEMTAEALATERESLDGKTFCFDIGESYYDGTTLKLDPDCELAELDAFMYAHPNEPVFILSHFPLHYYNDRRVIKGARMVIDVLNQYPNAVFLWGHNHTENDPMYGKIYTEGDYIMPYAPGTGAGDGDTGGNTREILFTYVSLGATKAKTIFGANAVHAKASTENSIDTVVFNYLTHNDKESDAGFIADNSDVNSPKTVITSKNAAKTISNVSLSMDEPVYEGDPSSITPTSFSSRFKIDGAVSWTPEATTFAYDTEYTATITLKPEADVTFSEGATCFINGEAVTMTLSDSNTTATIEKTFEKTVEKGEGTFLAVATIVDGGKYYLASNLYAMKDDLSGERIAADGYNFTSVPGEAAEWIFEKDGDGYSIHCGSVYLGLSSGGGVSLKADKAPDELWTLDVDGYVKCGNDYLAVNNGQFGLSSTPGVKAYKCGDAEDVSVFSMTVVPPLAGEAFIQPVGCSDRYSVSTEFREGPTIATGNAEYGKEYQATITVELDPGLSAANSVFIRVNGEILDQPDGLNVTDSKVTFYQFFNPTRGTPVEPDVDGAIVPKDVETLEDGEQYLILVDGIAIVNNPVDNVVEGQNYNKNNKIYNDMIWTASQGDSGFTLTNGAKQLTAVSQDSLSLTGDGSQWSFAEGNISTTVAGDGPPPPPPGGGGDPLVESPEVQPTGTQGESDDANISSDEGTSDSWVEPPPQEGGGAPPPPQGDVTVYVDKGSLGSADVLNLSTTKPSTVSLKKIVSDFSGDVEVHLDRSEDATETDVTEDFTISFENEIGNPVNRIGFGKYYVCASSTVYGFDNKKVAYFKDGKLYDMDDNKLDEPKIDIFSFVAYNQRSNEIDRQYLLKGDTAKDNVSQYYGENTLVWSVNKWNRLESFDFSSPVNRPVTLTVMNNSKKSDSTLLMALMGHYNPPSRRVEVINDKREDFDKALAIYSAQQADLAVNQFSDVSKDDWFFGYVTDLTRDGVVNGYPDGTFQPQGIVTCGEALKLIMKAVGYPDILPTAEHWASGYMDKALEDGLIDAAFIDLDAPIDRLYVAEIAARALKLNVAGFSAATSPFADCDAYALIALYDAGVVEGSFGQDGQRLYHPNDNITRAEVSAIIWRITGRR